MTVADASTSSIRQEEAKFEDVKRRGQQVYAMSVQPDLTIADHNKFVAIDIKTGVYTLDVDDYQAVNRLEALCPNAELWLMRAGHSTAYSLRPRSSAPLL